MYSTLVGLDTCTASRLSTGARVALVTTGVEVSVRSPSEKLASCWSSLGLIVCGLLLTQSTNSWYSLQVRWRHLRAWFDLWRASSFGVTIALLIFDSKWVYFFLSQEFVRSDSSSCAKFEAFSRNLAIHVQFRSIDNAPENERSSVADILTTVLAWLSFEVSSILWRRCLFLNRHSDDRIRL